MGVEIGFTYPSVGKGSTLHATGFCELLHVWVWLSNLLEGFSVLMSKGCVGFVPACLWEGALTLTLKTGFGFCHCPGGA